MGRVIGAKAHTARLRGIRGQEVVRKVGAALFAAGNAIQVHSQLSITAGAVSGKNHVPSAPGQPPNQDTGVLANNIETTQVAPLKVEVTSSAPYAVPLETGTSKMAARPYMAPAAAAKRREATQLVRNAVNQVLRDSRSSRRD